jgi:hypothetical protein
VQEGGVFLPPFAQQPPAEDFALGLRRCPPPEERNRTEGDRTFLAALEVGVLKEEFLAVETGPRDGDAVAVGQYQVRPLWQRRLRFALAAEGVSVRRVPTTGPSVVASTKRGASAAGNPPVGRVPVTRSSNASR